MLARSDFWQHVMPILVTAHHNNEDWWIVRDAPGTPLGRDKFCGCIRSVGDHIGWNRSTWMSPGHGTREFDDQPRKTPRK
jgi:hypothetical protein